MKEHAGKRELNKARKRADIVAIAKRWFFEHGYAATSMSAVSEELGGSKATLWAHFCSKEELFAAVIDELVNSFSRDIDELLTSQTFSPAALRRACVRLIECLLHENSVRLFRLVLSEGERFPEIAQMFYSRGPMKVRNCFAAFYATKFSPADAHWLAQFTTATIVGYRSNILLQPARPTSREHEIFVDNLIASIKWPEPEDHKAA